MEFHIEQISDNRYLEKVFKNLQEELNLADDAPPVGIEALETKLFDLGIIYVENDESRRSSWTKIC